MSIGTPIQARVKNVAPVFCSACGHQLDAGARFCASCGQAVAGKAVAGKATSVRAASRATRGTRVAPVTTIVDRPQNNFTKIAALVAGLALLGGIVALALHSRTQQPVANVPAPVVVTEPGEVARPVAIPGPDYDGSLDPVLGIPLDGVGALTSAVAAPVVIDLYSDFSCPYCRQFKTDHGDELLRLAADPNFSVRYHPVNFLDRSGDGTGWSTLAASVFLQTAASDPAHTWDVSVVLLDHQGDGLTGDAVVELVNQATGANLPPMGQILPSQNALLGGFMDNARAMNIDSVPTILINGVAWDRNGSLYEAAQRALP